MRLIRAEVEPGFIAVDNAAETADLSCRALGLLTRWLRTRPGEEIPPIPDMVKRRKGRGCKRIEGKAALYSASHELEREGFLVRRLELTDGGSYEWAAYVYPAPVPEAERSNPDDRSRRSARVPKNRVSEVRDPEDWKPKTGNPSSSSKRLSNSLSGDVSGDAAADADLEPVTVERENPAPQTDAPTPAPAAAADAPPGDATGTPGGLEGVRTDDDSSPGAEIAPQRAAGGFVAQELATQWRATHGTAPGRRQLAAVAADASDALTDGDAPDWLTQHVVPFMVRRRYLDLGRARTHRDCPAPRTSPGGSATADGMCPDHPTYRAGDRCIPCVMA